MESNSDSDLTVAAGVAEAPGAAGIVIGDVGSDGVSNGSSARSAAKYCRSSIDSWLPERMWKESTSDSYR
jgi:hypothetical protein